MTPTRPMRATNAWKGLAGAVLIAAAGCSSLSPEEQARRDKTLHEYRSAADAMRRADFQSAKTALDDAVTTLGGLTAGDKTAREARSYFREESRKNFRGEPYERVMAYYYRGILYWMDGEPDNARACFRSAAIQDADPEQHNYDSDYVLLDYLDALATVKTGGDGSDAFGRALKNARGLKPPAPDPKANVLFFVEMGKGPGKYASGEHGERLMFSAGSSSATSASIAIDGSSGPIAPAYDDLTFQATTRGGRIMDHILAGKAVFKDTTDVIGNAAIIGGAGTMLLSRGDTGREVGAGLLVAGIISKVVSAATTPEADTRAWDNLPNYLGFAALTAAPGHHDAVVEFKTPSGAVTLRRNIGFDVVKGRDTVIFLSDQR
jgi:hypothetical protein